MFGEKLSFSFIPFAAFLWVLCLRLWLHMVRVRLFYCSPSVCSCWKWLGRTPARASARLYRVIVALRERGVTHTSSICSSVAVMFMFARWPMWLKLIYKHLKSYSGTSCCQPPPYPHCRYAEACSEHSFGVHVCDCYLWSTLLENGSFRSREHRWTQKQNQHRLWLYEANRKRTGPESGKQQEVRSTVVQKTPFNLNWE